MTRTCLNEVQLPKELQRFPEVPWNDADLPQ